MINHVVNDRICYTSCLNRIHLVLIEAVFDVMVKYAQNLPPRIGGRENNKILIEMMVGKGDERLVPGSIVPAQSAHRSKMAHAHVKNAW